MEDERRNKGSRQTGELTHWQGADWKEKQGWHRSQTKTQTEEASRRDTNEDERKRHLMTIIFFPFLYITKTIFRKCLFSFLLRK